MQYTKKLLPGGDGQTIAITYPGKNRTNAIATGCFFIAATLFAIIGVKCYDPLLQTPRYLLAHVSSSNAIITGAVCEMIVVAANCGTAIMLYPYLKQYNQRLAMGYVIFRVLESVLITIGAVSMLALLTLSNTAATAVTNDFMAAAGTGLKALHDWTFILGPKFFLGINTFIYSYVLFRTALVPGKLALLGITGAILVFITAWLELYGFVSGFSPAIIILILPIASYEMILAGWLIAKGFTLRSIQTIN